MAASTLVRPLLLGRQHLEAALVSKLHNLRPPVAPDMIRVAAAPDALTPLEVVDGRARHHLLAYAMPNGWLACAPELAPAPLLLSHRRLGSFIPKHVLALDTQAREDDAHGGKAFGRFPIDWALELRHEALATLDLLHFEPLLVVDVLDHAIFLVGESAPGLLGETFGVEVLGVAATALEGAVEAVVVRALAEALRH